jgi:hypothetical protein
MSGILNKKSLNQNNMAKRRRKSNRRRTSYRRRRSSLGLGGISTSKLSAKNAAAELLDAALIAGGAIAAAKGIGMLDKAVNKSGSKMMGFVAPAVVTAAGVAGAMMGGGMVKSVAKGVALGGAVKVAEKAMNKENLISGLDDDQPLMLPGIGSYGQAALPELSHYSENPDAPVTTTGGDPQYYMGQPSELLSGYDEVIAY